MLKVENLTFRYSKFSRPVLNGASLELKAGEVGILLGKNGSGKTTLFTSILKKACSPTIFIPSGIVVVGQACSIQSVALSTMALHPLRLSYTLLPRFTFIVFSSFVLQKAEGSIFLTVAGITMLSMEVPLKAQ